MKTKIEHKCGRCGTSISAEFEYCVGCNEDRMAGGYPDARKQKNEKISLPDATCPGRGDCAKCGNCAADAATENWDGVGHPGDTSELEAAARWSQGYPD